MAIYDESLTVMARSGGRDRIADGSAVTRNTGAINFGGGGRGDTVLLILSNPLIRLYIEDEAGGCIDAGLPISGADRRGNSNEFLCCNCCNCFFRFLLPIVSFSFLFF